MGQLDDFTDFIIYKIDLRPFTISANILLNFKFSFGAIFWFYFILESTVLFRYFFL